MVRANSICFVGQVLLGVVGQQPGQQQQRVERGTQLVAHVGQELRLVRRRPGTAAAPSPPGRAGPARSRGSSSRCCAFCSLSSCALSSSSALVRCSSADWSCISRASRCDCGEQLLGTPVGLDGVERDADRGDQPLEERQVQLGEGGHRGELDHAEHLALEQHRQHDQVVRAASTSDRSAWSGRRRGSAPDPDRAAGDARPGRPAPRPGPKVTSWLRAT